MMPDSSPISPDAAIRKAAVDRLKWVIEMTADPRRRAAGRPVPFAAGGLQRQRPHGGREVAGRRGAAAGGRLRQTGQGQAGHRVSEPLRVLLPDDGRRRPEPGQGGRIIRTSRRCTTPSTPTSRRRTSRRRSRSSPDSFVHVHISENDRGTPGTGHVHWDETFAALHKVKYDGWLTIEAFGRALPDLAAATQGLARPVPGGGRGLHAEAWRS